jgi:AAA15 family ATPase/GTPase
MRIAKIFIKGFKQFDNVELDLTNPITGEPLDKVCFIGKNGTGKSSLLSLLNFLLFNIHNVSFSGQGKWVFALKLIDNGKTYYLLYFPTPLLGKKILLEESGKSKSETPEFEVRKNVNEEINGGAIRDGLKQLDFEEFKYKKFISADDSNWQYTLNEFLKIDLLIYSPAESFSNDALRLSDVPETNLNQALQLFDDFPINHFVSNDKIDHFWKTLVFLIKKRENQREEFETDPININKTKSQLIEEFDNVYPKILNRLSVLWNKILNKSGLEFDIDNAKNPIQLGDNLKAYIKLINKNSRVPYNELSTGIRNFIFRLGHIYSLYFSREIKKGFLLIDEPENSLYPDFLFDLVETYQEVVKDKNGEQNTQIFMATHNPIIAAQFEPYERIILEFDDNGFVTSHKGHSPIGDDPNDILKQDFELGNLMGKAGLAMWDKYQMLKKKLRNSNDEKEKESLLVELNKIGSDYNF